MTSVAADDEVSPVLRHFRPRPGFAANGRDRGPPRRRNQRCGPDARGFSGVRYVADNTHTNANDTGEGELRMTYLHVHDAPNLPDMHVFLSFEITVVTKAVTCVQCSAPDGAVASRVKARLEQRCADLSSSGRPPTAGDCSSTSTSSTPSLFFVVSQLLQFLNDDFPLSPFDDPAPPREPEALGAMASRIAAMAAGPARSPATVHRLLDLETLLLRCAAAGRNRLQVCAPVPVEFAASAAPDVQGSPVDALSRLVFAATNQLYAYGFRNGHQTQMQQPTSGADEAARTLLPFLLSLPWTMGSRLAEETVDSDENENGTQRGNGESPRTTPSNGRVVRLCLDAGTALGDPPPAFARAAAAYGTVRAYHGTKVESAWSVLHHGLRNLSDHGALAQNGAMLGAGVYLSSSRRVAEAFAITAAERPPPTLPSAFQTEALLRLLCHAGADVDGLEPLDEYDIVCLPVFEALIIKPPRQPAATSSGGKIGVSDKNECSSRGSDATHVTRQEGKYFVCTDGEFVRITKLYLTIELSKRSDMWHFLRTSRIPLSLIVLFVAMYWVTR